VEVFSPKLVHVPFAITKWGGYSLDNAFLDEDKELWSYDPFKLFREVFNPSFPAPDITTENGNRILIAHIDGDAFFGVADFNPKKHLGEVLKEEILTKFKIPHGVSVIEGEIAPWGLYPNESKKLMKIAKEIFALPNVEMASHTFSHPFDWRIVGKESKVLPAAHNLPIKGYVFNVKREIFGSVNFINRYLSPDGKKRTIDLFWSGNCDPDRNAVELTYKAKVYNMNGGDTTINYSEPFLSCVAPSGVNFGNFYQIYAPISNEMYYTNDWHGPYWGFIRVIQTFKLTDKPRRLKPIDIYYHFYSCQKLSSLNALKRVYKYALSQEVIPLFPSQYSQIVLDARNTVIYGNRKEGFTVKNQGFCRTLRVPISWGYPDVLRSVGVIGYRKINNYYYIHLSGSGNYKLLFSNKKPKFRLISSNGRVKKWIEKKKDDSILLDLELQSYQKPTYANLESSCRIKLLKGRIEKRKKTLYRLLGEKGIEFKVICSK